MNELKEILKEIDERIEKLPPEDVESHIWFYKFREIILAQMKSSLK